jgi:hypothetical protein
VQITKLLVPSYLLGSNILLSTLISNTLSLCPTLNVTDLVSHPYRITGKITEKSHNTDVKQFSSHWLRNAQHALMHLKQWAAFDIIASDRCTIDTNLYAVVSWFCNTLSFMHVMFRAVLTCICYVTRLCKRARYVHKFVLITCLSGLQITLASLFVLWPHYSSESRSSRGLVQYSLHVHVKGGQACEVCCPCINIYNVFSSYAACW